MDLHKITTLLTPYSSKVKEGLRVGLLYWGIASLIVATQFALFMKGSSVTEVMDFSGWLFFLTSCLAYAAKLCLVPLLVLFLPCCLLRHWRIGGWLMVIAVSLLSIVVFLDMQVYDIYKFHINGIVLNMVFSSGADEIFTFDTLLYIKEVLLFAIFIVLHVTGWLLSVRTASRWSFPRVALTALCSFLGITLCAEGMHIYGDFYQKTSVLKSRRMLPYYEPTSATELLTALGFTPPSSVNLAAAAQGDVNYPLHPIVAEPKAEKLNIVWILIDSWSTRTLNAETMPHLYAYAQENSRYENHFSCSNATRSSVFSQFFSIPSYYWDIFGSSHVSPVFFDQLLRQGYDCQVYPSATLLIPPFHRVVFQQIPNLNTTTEGKTTYDRDRRLTDNFLRDLDRHDPEKPFFSLLFYDLPHSFELPADKNTQFQPAWKFADYSKLDNDTDPTPFYNLYRNCCYQVDLMVADVLEALREKGLDEHTVVLVTGDHSQEFNENKKNYWGHVGNYTRWQVGVPMIVHVPGQAPASYSHRTTHYDLVPTLMRDVLGVTNPFEDYSDGYGLEDQRPRHWQFVGSETTYAFIITGDTIVEKVIDGSLDVTDAHLNPAIDYKINPKEFNAAMKRLNRFLK